MTNEGLQNRGNLRPVFHKKRNYCQIAFYANQKWLPKDFADKYIQLFWLWRFHRACVSAKYKHAC